MNPFFLTHKSMTRFGTLRCLDSRQASIPLPEFSNWFPELQPLEIELGAGKCHFLLSRAQANPGINFVALDWSRKWLSIGAERALKKNVKNLRFIWGHALEVLPELPKRSVSVFHIYFSDPWPKRKHNERRLLSPSCFEMLYEALTLEGSLEIATDYADYYQAIKHSAAVSKVCWGFAKQQANQRIFDPAHKTNYEIKYEAVGRPLYYLELKKR